jgi:hypothetical protein
MYVEAIRLPGLEDIGRHPVDQGDPHALNARVEATADQE